MSLAVLALASGAPAFAQSAGPKLGISAPLSGPSAILGEQIRKGAEVAAAAAGAMVEIRDDGCTAEGGATAAREFVQTGVAVVVGYLCTEALEAALPILKDAGIPAITVGVRTDSITDRRPRTGWPMFRLAPRDDGEAAAIAGILPRLWRDHPFAIVDDGAIRSRDVTETLRIAAEDAGLKPVFVDVFRPDQANQKALVEKLSKAGAERVFVSGGSADIAIITQDAATQKFAAIFAGGEALSEQQVAGLARGTLMIGLPEWRELATPEGLLSLDKQGILPDGYVLPSYAAVQIAAEAAKTGSPLPSLGAAEFQTIIGPIRFDPKGDLGSSPYRLFEYDGRRFLPAESE